MLNRNQEIKTARGKIPKWVIAERLGVHENTFNIWMRQEMTAEKKRTVLQVISDIKAEMAGVAK